MMENTTATIKTKNRLTGRYLLKGIKKTWLEQLDPKHDGLHQFTGTQTWICPERASTGLIKTGLTDEEARALESEMGLKPMELSPYSSFWSNYKLYVRIPQEGVTLDLDRSALDKVRFAYLSVCDKVALSYEDANEDPRKEYVLSNREKEAVNESKKILSKVDAMKKFAGMSLDEQLDFLKVYESGKYKVSKSATAEFITATLGKIVDESPDKFLEVISNPDYKAHLFLGECLQSGIVKKSGPKYFISGGDLLGNTYTEAIANLQDPKYNEVKIGLKAKLDALK